MCVCGALYWREGGKVCCCYEGVWLDDDACGIRMEGQGRMLEGVGAGTLRLASRGGVQRWGRGHLTNRERRWRSTGGAWYTCGWWGCM
jgi:hypothetical protein